MNKISYITANQVARPLGYKMKRGWMQGDDAVHDLFRPVERYEERFDELIQGISELGFTSVDLWGVHLHPSWATKEHMLAARRVLDIYKMEVTAFAMHWGSTIDDLHKAARVLEVLGTDLISGNQGLLATDRPALARELRTLNLRFAYENHPERSAAEMLEKIGPDDQDVLGIAFDTGWAGTGEFDAVEALPLLLPRLMHIHAKDVKARPAQPTGYPLKDMGHETCALGDGIVNVEAVLRQAVTAGFTGPIGIEHEPEDHDPAEDCRVSLERVKEWLNL